MPINTASYSPNSSSILTSVPISVSKRNSIPMPSKMTRRLRIMSFSILNSGIPKVNKPPISGRLSKITGVTPFLTKISAHPSPAGPAPIIATFLSVQTTSDISGRQPSAKAVSLIYFSTLPIVTAPKPSFSVQAPSHKRSCGQTRPQTSGKVLV